MLERITTLEATAVNRQAIHQTREETAQNLARVAKAGQALYQKVVGSDDSWPIKDVQAAYVHWREQLRAACSSAAQAEYVDGIAAVKDAGIVGMPPSATQEERNGIALHIHARLGRLGNIMKDS